MFLVQVILWGNPLLTFVFSLFSIRWKSHHVVSWNNESMVDFRSVIATDFMKYLWREVQFLFLARLQLSTRQLQWFCFSCHLFFDYSGSWYGKLRQETEMDTCAARFNPSMLWHFDKASKRRSHKWRRLLLSEANCTPSSVTTKEIVTCRCTFSFTFPIHQSQSNFQTDYERLQTRLGCSTFIFATSFQDRVLFRLTCTTANRDTKVKTQETLRTKKKPRIISSAKGSLLYCPLEICSVPCR